MRKVLMLVFIILIVSIVSAIPATAREIPFDTDGDRIISKAELSGAIISYLRAEYLGETLEAPDIDGLKEIAWIYLHYPRTVMDSAGRNVTVYAPVKRIVVLNGDCAEAVKILGADERIVGVVKGIKTKKGYYFPELNTTPSVGKWNRPDIEAIVSLDPDLVIGYVKWPGAELDEKLEKFDIPTLRLDFTNQRKLKEEVEKLGYLLDEEEKAEEYIGWYRGYEEVVKEFVEKQDKRPRVFLEQSKDVADLNEIGTYGPGSASDELCMLAGGINIAHNLSTTFPHVEAEWVLKEHPDIVIKHRYVGWGWNNTDEPQGIKDEILSRPGWKDVIGEENVYVTSCEPLYGLDSVVGLIYWTKIFHPAFDLDPEGVYREYLERFLGIEYPEGLVVVYPPVGS